MIVSSVRITLNQATMVGAAVAVGSYSAGYQRTATVAAVASTCLGAFKLLKRVFNTEKGAAIHSGQPLSGGFDQQEIESATHDSLKSFNDQELANATRESLEDEELRHAIEKSKKDQNMGPELALREYCDLEEAVRQSTESSSKGTSVKDTTSSDEETSTERETALQNWVDQVEKYSPEYNDRLAALRKIENCYAGETMLDLSRTCIKSFEGIEGILAGLGSSCVISLPTSLNNESLKNFSDKVIEVAGPALKMAF